MTKETDRIFFRVRGMYFSGTGTTERIVTRIAQRLADTVKTDTSGSKPNSSEAAGAYRPAEKLAVTDRQTAAFTKEPDIDFTPPSAREKIYRFGPEDIVIFGVPVIAGRVPNVLLPFLHTLEGDGAMAVPVVLYGNRNFDDALIELRDILEEQGFHTIAAAAFIGEHSFSRKLAAGRPDAQDLRVAEAFTDAVAEKVCSLWRDAWKDAGPIEVEGQQPYRPYYKPRDRQGNHINILKVKPKLDPAKCTRCGICADACPMGSIHAENPGVVDGICIKCCGCEKKCPEGALYFDDPGYLYHKEELELGYPERQEPKVFL